MFNRFFESAWLSGVIENIPPHGPPTTWSEQPVNLAQCRARFQPMKCGGTGTKAKSPFGQCCVLEGARDDLKIWRAMGKFAFQIGCQTFVGLNRPKRFGAQFEKRACR